MSIEPPRCPLCNETFDDSGDLESHLVDEHTESELAEHVVANWEAERSTE
ncbi:hypothetical protein [Haloarchaeobius sp. HRN-SO-5]